jgi:SAM-dependent methyltransferase
MSPDQVPASSLARYFDGWYAGMAGSPVKDEIQQRHLGLPPGLPSTSLLTWAGIADVTAALRLSRGDTLFDLACSRGGYGLEIAARTGARLVGIDFSAEAVRQAREQARGLDRTAHRRRNPRGSMVPAPGRQSGAGPAGRSRRSGNQAFHEQEDADDDHRGS